MFWKGSTATVVGLPALAVGTDCRCLCKKKTVAPRITEIAITETIAMRRLRLGGVIADSTFTALCEAELFRPAVAFDSAMVLAR
jgi:hypothetical protein